MVHTRAYLRDLSSHFAEALDHEAWPGRGERDAGADCFRAAYRTRFGAQYHAVS